MFLGLLRFITVAAIIIFSIVKMADGGEVCPVEDYDDERLYEEDRTLGKAISNISEESIVVKFDPRGWVTAIPVLTYAFILHQGLASLTHPIKQKRYMWYLTAAMFSTALFCYMSLGVIVPLWFRESIQETVTLNFVSFTWGLWAELFFILFPFSKFGLSYLSDYLLIFCQEDGLLCLCEPVVNCMHY